MEKLMFALVGLFFLFSSPDAAATISTVPVDKYCYMLIESPQNHSFCRQSYNYDSIDVYFKDFNGKDVKAVVKRQFRKTAPTVLINTQYSFEGICAAGANCNLSFFAQDTLMAFRRAVINKAFYTYIDDDVTPCIPGTICVEPQSADLAFQAQAAAAGKVVQAIKNAQTIAQTAESAVNAASTAMDMKNTIGGAINQPIMYTPMYGTDGALIGYCMINAQLGCQSVLKVVSDSTYYHESILTTPADLQGNGIAHALDNWMMTNRPQLSCLVSQTTSTLSNGSRVVTTIRTCSVH
ncbi:hypothetical protein [Rheinheimera faecalis]|uniref:hypothetical protein n=1 Tax=Rheinheimera faecalis TaxID=2901141 RepID=UPI001E2A2457|nr:hypothetical protein [Rheinheimera faecalis]